MSSVPNPNPDRARRAQVASAREVCAYVSRGCERDVYALQSEPKIALVAVGAGYSYVRPLREQEMWVGAYLLAGMTSPPYSLKTTGSRHGQVVGPLCKRTFWPKGPTLRHEYGAGSVAPE